MGHGQECRSTEGPKNKALGPPGDREQVKKPLYVNLKTRKGNFRKLDGENLPHKGRE